METLNREDILRMIGLRDSAGLFSKINSLMIDMYDEGGKLAEYSTQIIQTEKNITLLAQRVTDNETDIADLTVTAQEISQTVEHQQDEIDSVTGTVNGHTTQIGQLQTTAQQISASVSSLTTTVNGHTQSIGQLVVRDNEISQTVSSLSDDVDAIDGTVTNHTTQIGQLQTTTQQITASVSSLTTTVNGHTQSIGQLVVRDNEISQTVSSLSDDVDELDGTVTNHTSQISTLRTDLNGISATVSADHTTLGQHTTKIGQLEITANQVSQRVTVIEGDYVKEAEISLMVKYDPNTGYISNALVNADDITFVFTDAVTWYWQSQADANKRMGLDSNGDLWISGQYRGGTITDNVVVGTSGGKMEIYSDEVVTGSLKKSGLRGVVGSNTVLDLGFTRLNSELSPYFMMHGTAPFIAQPVTMTMHPYSMSIGIDSGNAIRFGIGPTGKIEISGSWPSAWPSRDEVGVGDVFVEDDEILRVRLT